jgi:protein TonB
MRFVLSLAAGAFVSILLFWLMGKLIAGRQHSVEPDNHYKVVEGIHLKRKVEEEKEVQEKEKTPTRAMQSPAVPSLFHVEMPVPDLPKLVVDVPRLTFIPDLSTVPAIGDVVVVAKAGGSGYGSSGSGSGDSYYDIEIIPHGTIQPAYPEAAAIHKLEGWVKVEFTINEGGWVEDIVVLDSEPKGIFEQNTVNAVSTWKYRPIPTPIRASQYIEFTLDQLQYFLE